MRLALTIAGLCGCALALSAATPPKRRPALAAVKKRLVVVPPPPPGPRVLNDGEGGAPNGQPLTDAPIRASAVRWVTEKQVNAIAPGSTVTQVVEQLGQPFSRLVGDTQRFTYVMKNGSSAKLDFEDGKLIGSRILPPER